MLSLGKITKDQYTAAIAEKIIFQPQSLGGIKAPHFVMAVQDYLVQKYGDAMVDTGGLKVTTTLDWNLQQDAEKAVSDGVARNTQLYDSTNGALVAEDPQTGQILGTGWLGGLFRPVQTMVISMSQHRVCANRDLR